MERHASGRVGWLRAGVLGANDGLLSTAGLLVGVAAADVSRCVLLTTGLAALFAGAFSMAVGEYSSVSSQRDAELADLPRSRTSWPRARGGEQAELTGIYVRRGLTHDAGQPGRQPAHRPRRARGARARRAGPRPDALARPVQAAVSSALSFTIGALVAILVVVLVARRPPHPWRRRRHPRRARRARCGRRAARRGAGRSGRGARSSSAVPWPWPSAPPSAKPSAPRSDPQRDLTRFRSWVTPKSRRCRPLSPDGAPGRVADGGAMSPTKARSRGGP